jgi:hypothetical protein
VPERFDRPIGDDRERQHVETLGTIEAHELGFTPRSVAYGLPNARIVPWHSIDARLAVFAERSVEPEKLGFRARRQKP